MAEKIGPPDRLEDADDGTQAEFYLIYLAAPEATSQPRCNLLCRTDA
jgi:hypothetical protein